MRYTKLSILLLAAAGLFWIGCGQEKTDGQADLVLSQARSSFYRGEYGKALLLIDSLQRIEPKPHQTIKVATLLRDSVVWKKSSMQFDSLHTKLIYQELEIQKAGQASDTDSLIRQNDSLHREKDSLRRVISDIERKALQQQACTQCRTIMQGNTSGK